jgi:hypothetical protein
MSGYSQLFLNLVRRKDLSNIWRNCGDLLKEKLLLPLLLVLVNGKMIVLIWDQEKLIFIDT